MALPFDMAANCRRYICFCRDWPPGQSCREAARRRTVGDAGPYKDAEQKDRRDAGPYENRQQAVFLPPQAAMPSPGEKVARRAGSGMRATKPDVVHAADFYPGKDLCCHCEAVRPWQSPGIT